MLKRLQVTDDIPQQVVEKLLRSSKHLIKSYKHKNHHGVSLRKLGARAKGLGPDAVMLWQLLH